MTPNSNFFCASPFSEVRINHDGSMNFCHYAQSEYINEGENISGMTIDEYFNKSVSVKERKILLQGGKIERCERCYKEEKINEMHFRQRRNLQFGIFPNEDFAQSYNESSIKEYVDNDYLQPHFYHISLSNLCNLGCIMCNGQNSSVMAKDLKAASITHRNTPTLLDWTTDKNTWKSFLDHIVSNKKIICVHFMGGEPMYHKKFYEFIDYCVDVKHHYFHLTFVTNGTIVPDADFMVKLKKFQSVQIEVSIESFDDSNNYVRFPSDWRAIKSNLEKYLNYTQNNISLVIRSVPQFFTLLEYDQLLQWCLDNRVVIDSNMISSPAFFKPAYLTDDIKKKVREKLKKFVITDSYEIADINVRDANNIKNCLSINAKTILNLLDEPARDKEKQMRDMIIYLAKLDKIRKIDVRVKLPEFADLINSYGYEEVRN